uniref:Retrotransposon gag domain-containing protein n=1 Tax=Tanacetum cinerariifolium TaxID=118510 RepID=A0A6L2LHY7_TANCI|nr:hypothetical protein [Tanacetum cinerariifolium]
MACIDDVMLTNSKLKIKDEFLKILQDGAFNGMNGEDVADHIAKVLKITERIKMPNIEKNTLRLHVFSNSLSGDSRKWWNKEIERTTIDWNEMCNKFLREYYPLSRSYNSKGPDDLDNDKDYLEFLYWLALKFDNYWEIDKNTQYKLWEFYMNKRTNRMIDDLNIKECSDTFYKPYLDSQDDKDIYKVIDREILRYQSPLLATSTTQTSYAEPKNLQ